MDTNPDEAHPADEKVLMVSENPVQRVVSNVGAPEEPVRKRLIEGNPAMQQRYDEIQEKLQKGKRLKKDEKLFLNEVESRVQIS